MKYCPYCGADLLSDDVSFCSECGQRITESKPEQKKDKKEKPHREKVKKKSKKESKKATSEVSSEPVDDGYDGYYDDVLPPDLDRVKEGLDKELIKKIVALGAVVLLIIALCVVMMYIL